MIHLLRRVDPESRAELLDAIESALSSEASPLPPLRFTPSARAAGPRSHRPDRLAVDASGTLHLVSVALLPTDDLLVRALSQHASAVQDAAELAALFDEPRPDARRMPALVLVLPEISPSLIAAAAAVGTMPVELLRYRFYAVAGDRAFALERAGAAPGDSAGPIEPFRTGLGGNGETLTDAEILELLRGGVS